MVLQTEENLEDFIVRLLAERPNLSASEIHKSIRVKEGLFTIQAIYKELRKLQGVGVVVKASQLYSLRLSWALCLTALANKISKNYFNTSFRKKILSGGSKKKIWHFNNLLKLNEFWSQILLALIQESEKKVLLGYNPHPWFHFAQTKQEEQYIKSISIARGTLYLIIGGRTYLDRWTEKFFDKKIIRFSFGKSIFEKERSKYLNVIDEYVLTVKLDDATTKAIEAFYMQTTNIEELNLSDAMAIFNRKVKATIQLEKNRNKAKIIKGRFARFFGIDFI